MIRVFIVKHWDIMDQSPTILAASVYDAVQAHCSTQYMRDADQLSNGFKSKLLVIELPVEPLVDKLLGEASAILELRKVAKAKVH